MKIFDDKGKLFGIFNIVDLCVIVLLVVIAGGAYIFLKENIVNSAPTNTYNVTMQIKNVEKDFCDSIIPGKTVYDRIHNQKYGVLNDVRVEPAVEYNPSQLSGEILEVAVPDRYNVELDMTLTADEEIYVGKSLSVATKDFTGAGYVIKTEKSEE